MNGVVKTTTYTKGVAEMKTRKYYNHFPYMTTWDYAWLQWIRWQLKKHYEFWRL